MQLGLVTSLCPGLVLTHGRASFFAISVIRERCTASPRVSADSLFSRRKVRRAGEEDWVSDTFAVLAISSQLEPRGTGTAVGAKCVLACVLAQAARGGPAFIHICGQATKAGGKLPEVGSLHPQYKRGLEEGSRDPKEIGRKPDRDGGAKRLRTGEKGSESVGGRLETDEGTDRHIKGQEKRASGLRLRRTEPWLDKRQESS